MNIQDIITDIIATALAVAALALIRSGVAWLSAKTKSEKIQRALQEFQTVLEDGIGYVEQTFVRLAKENGTWNTTSQQEALGACIDYIKGNLTQKAYELLTEDKEDIEDWITAKIESYISYSKER